MPTRPYKAATESARAEWTPEVREFRERLGEQLTVEAAAQAAIGREIAAARTAANLSQKQLAALAAVQQADLSRIERGAANPTIATVAKIAKALGTELSLTSTPVALSH